MYMKCVVIELCILSYIFLLNIKLNLCFKTADALRYVRSMFPRRL